MANLLIPSRTEGIKQYQTTQATLIADTAPDVQPPPSIDDPSETGLSTVEDPASLSKGIKDEDTKKKEKWLEVELAYLQDPLKLAENTISLLRKDDLEKALDMVRVASKQRQCIVSWNHIIDYQMSNGRYNLAVKVYNEVCLMRRDYLLYPEIADRALQMKKRAQQPDAQTYTIILRGLSWVQSKEEVLPRALKIYHSMFADNSPVKPNIIHTNAMLRICALSKDMDALWGVAAKLPTKGRGAPDKISFSVILNAIRTIAWHKDKDLPDEKWEEISLRRQRAVMQGRKIWEDIIPRWRAGDMWIDEELVCAMGRLLLLGSTDPDYDDVLSLVEQTMAIPHQRSFRPERLTDTANGPSASPTPPETNGPEHDAESQKGDSNPLHKNEQITWSPSTTYLAPPPTLESSTALDHVFQPSSTPLKPSISTARPGRNTLGLLLAACIALRSPPTGQSYWGILTDPSGPYKVIPDVDNYHGYLRLLRVQRASRVAADLIEDMHTGALKDLPNVLQIKTFRIAFSCCVRDKNNNNVMDHAQRILQVMTRALPEPDIKALEMYVQLAAFQAKTNFQVTLTALRALEPGFKLLKNYINYGYGDIPRDEEIAARELAQTVTGAYDAVLDYAGDRLSQEDRAECIHMIKWLGAWVFRRKRAERESSATERAETRKERRGEGRGEEWQEEAALVGADSKSGLRQPRSKRPMKYEKRVVEGGMKKRTWRAQVEMDRSGEFDF
ncbi:MAG: hypothetical protein Q9220_001041 [cf. Caloplaca sp. 1 TL-2023]